MKMRNMQLCALDEGAFNLKILCQRKRVSITLASDKSTFLRYWMLLETTIQTDSRASIHCVFPVLKTN